MSKLLSRKRKEDGDRWAGYPPLLRSGTIRGMHTSDESSFHGRKLTPVLGLASAAAIVVGQVIGSGIFLKPNEVARATDGHVGLILFLWFACGLVNLCGALALAELSAMMPHAGGTYVFLRECYGRLWSFLWTWAEFWIIRTGAIAALAVAFSMSVKGILPAANSPHGNIVADIPPSVLAIGAILLLGTVNIIRTKWGAAVQNTTTLIKAGFVLLLAALPFLVSAEHRITPESYWPSYWERGIWLGIGSALAAIMWAYDGWGTLTVVAEEVRNPQRNVPLALTIGVLLLIILYVGANWAYHSTLPVTAIEASDIPARDVAAKLLPGFGGNLLLAMLMVSLFGALNGNILIGPRVLFAAGRDYRKLAMMKTIDSRTGTPALAIAAMCAWSIMLILLADLLPKDGAPMANWYPLNRIRFGKPIFDLLTDYCIFGGSLFYLFAVIGVFVLRRRLPDAPRPYRAWGYPWVPGVFVVSYILLLVSMLVATPATSLGGLGLIVVGIPAYYWLRR